MSCKKNWIFAVQMPKGIKTEEINFDQKFWEQELFPKFNLLLFNCLLPEIVDPRYPTGPIRNPQYMLMIQNKKTKKKLKLLFIKSKNAYKSTVTKQIHYFE